MVKRFRIFALYAVECFLFFSCGRGEDGVSEYRITVAPYFRTELSQENYSLLLEESSPIHLRAADFAALVGAEVIAVEPLEGLYLGSGELSYRYSVLSSSMEKAELLAALLGDLGFEYQDAVIVDTDLKRGEEAPAYQVSVSVPEGYSFSEVSATLSGLGIDGASYSASSGQMWITAFDEQEVSDLSSSISSTGYVIEGARALDSRYLDNPSRVDIYRRTLSGNPAPTLRRACSKALSICQAAARYDSPDEEMERLDAANRAARQWEAENPGNKGRITPTALGKRLRGAEMKAPAVP